MQTSVRRMGNSAGILLPKPVLAHLRVQAGDVVEVDLENGRVVLTAPKPHPRTGWAEAAKHMGESETGLAWPEFANTEDADWEW